MVSLTLGGFLSTRSTCREASSVDVAEPRNESLELEVLRDQHRALRLAHHAVATELVELRARCEKSECAEREQTLNATKLFHKLESSERLRKRAILEAAELRRNFRDALARIAELEALSVPSNDTRSEDRAVRIHSRRRSIQNGNPAVFQNGVNSIFENKIQHQQQHCQRPPSSDPVSVPAAKTRRVPQPEIKRPVVTAENGLSPLVKPKKAVVLIPEYGHQASVVARARVATFAPPASESINSKLERGSKIYQQLQNELVRRSLGRDDSPSTKTFSAARSGEDDNDYSDSLFNFGGATMPEFTTSNNKIRRLRRPRTTTTSSSKESIRDKLSRGSKLYQELQYDMVKNREAESTTAKKATSSLSDYYNDAAFYQHQPPTDWREY